MTDFDFEPLQPISRRDLQNYAKVSGDHNEIHLDDRIARAHGLPGVIVHGMYLAGLMTSRAVGIKGAGKKIGKVKFRFKSMTLPEEQLLLGGRYLVDGSDLALEIRNEAGEIKLQGRFTIV